MQTANEQDVTEKKKRKPREIAPSAVTMPFFRACEIYGLAYKTGRAAVFRGELPILKIGRNWYVRRTVMERFLDSIEERFDPEKQQWRAR